MWNLIFKKLREERGLTQQDLADYLKISRTGYAHYELGNSQPSIEQIIKLAEFYEVTVDYLLNVSNVNLKNEKEIEDQIKKTISLLNEVRKKL